MKHVIPPVMIMKKMLFAFELELQSSLGVKTREDQVEQKRHVNFISLVTVILSFSV
jgi:hypothetical protein